MPRLGRAATLAGALVIAGASACSFILDFQECRDNADCEVDGGPPMTCSDDRRCVAADELKCTSHQACADDFGDDFLCSVGGTCVSALTAECTKIHWPTGERDKAVLLGTIIPVSPPYDAITVPLRNAVELAVEDFNKTVELPGGRRVAWLECDDHGVLERSQLAAEHLVSTVGAPAIVGPIFSEQVLKIAKEVTIPGDTFLITPTASNKDITTLDDKNLVWRPIPSDVYQASALRDRIPTIAGEACMVDAQCPGSVTCDAMSGCAAPKKVVVLTKNDAYGNGLYADMLAELEAKLPQGGLVHIAYPDPASFATVDELKSAYGAVIAQTFMALPDTVVILGTSEAADLVGGYLQALSTLNPVPMPPRFVFSHGAVPVMEKTITQIGDPAIETVMLGLVEGTSPIIQDPENFAAYNIRYKIRYSNQEALTTSSLSYDATLSVLFAMSTAGPEEAITGPLVAAGMAKLVDKAGTPVSFSADGVELPFIETARNTLAAGGTVDLQGVSGPLDYDLQTGEVRTDILGWDLLPKSGTTNVPVLTPTRIYVLDAPPATTGTWVPLMP